MSIDIAASASLSEAIVVGIGRDTSGAWDPMAEPIVASLGDGFDAFLTSIEFTGAAGQVGLYPGAGLDGVSQVVVLGLGEDVDAEVLRRAAGTLARRAAKSASVATTLASRDLDGAARSVTEGIRLGAYTFMQYRSEGSPSAIERVELVVGSTDGIGEEIAAGMAVADGVNLARDLVNTPAVDKSPAAMVAAAQSAVDDLGVRTVVYSGAELERERFGGLIGVAAGSDRPAHMLELWHEPEDPVAFLAFVGKGITFDSGGLSLKPAAGMETMKTDMSGAAAVIGAVVAIARLGLPVRVMGVTPLSDNMPGGSAIKPGDVLRPRNGKSIEILNTDAEGRLVLADGLTLATEQEPDAIIDLATLTGACKVALGEKIAGGMGTDRELLDRVIESGAKAGERIWPLPLPEDYRTLIDSPIADMKNTGGRFGGAITAALLLREFVDDRPWVHLDIAGPARWPDDEHYQFKGASGFGVRTLVALVEDIVARGL